MDRFDSEEAGLGARRLFCPTSLPGRPSFELGEGAAQHVKVLRLGVGAEVELFDGKGSRLPARIDELGRGHVRCSATGAALFTPRGPEVVLVQCVVKGKRLDDIVRMTTELGVTAIRLALSERCVVQKSSRDEHKAERLLRIASEAVRQSEQPYLPEITEPKALAQVLEAAPHAAQRIALTERSERPFEVAPAGPPVWLVVGPEGGLSSRDREILCHAKFTQAGLGRAILRTETAAVVGVGLAVSALGRGR